MRFGPLSIKHEIGFYVASSVAAALLFAGCSAFNSTPQQAQSYEQAAVCEQDGKECRSGLSANEAQCILRYAEGWYGCHCEYDPGGYSRDESEPFHDPYCSDRSKNIPFTPRQSSVVQRAPQTTGIRFLQGSTLRLVSFSNEQTSVVAYIGGIFRQTNGSLTLTRFLKTASSMRYVRSIPNVQDLLASASGLPVPALVPHPTLLADFPGTPAMEFTVARLSASIPYSGILSSDRGITITNGAAEALFLNKTDYPLPSSTPKSVATADFNGDGRRDVVVLDKAGGTPSPSNATTGRLHVFLGNGDGTLRTAVSYQLAEYPAAMVVYDFNRDNRPDVAVLMEGSSSTPTTQVLLVLLANADGTLRAPQSYPIPGLRSWTTPSTLAAGDFDGDNHGDVIVFCKSLGLILFRGNGDGTFLPGATRTGYALPTWGGFLAPGDLNRDAKLDLAILNQDGSLSLLLNGGDGSFPIHRRYAAGTQVSSGVFAPGIFLTDFNDDGAVDVVLGNGHPDALYTNPTFVSVLYGKGDGTLWAAPLEATTRYPGSLASADFNGDGWLDLVVAPNLSGDIGVQVFAGRPGGGFQTPVELPGGGSYDSVAAADLNADGKLDLAAANGSRSLVVWLGNGNGTFQTQQQYTYASSGFFTARLALGDLSGDSRADVALALGNRRSTSGAPSYALTLTSRSPSGFHTAVQVPTGLNTVSLALADVNADNKLDLIAANYGYRPSSETPTSGSVTVSLGRGDGTFLAPVAYTVQQNPGVVLVRDINKDGKPDLLAATAGTDLANVAVLLGRGDGTFQTPLLSPLYAQARALVVADFDADGKWDLVAVHTQGDKAVSVLRGKGDGTFADGVPYEAGYDVIDAAVGDFDANCQPDLAAISRPDTGPGVMAIFANTSPGAAGCVTTTVTTIPAGRSVAVDGVTLTAPATFQWTAGTPHTLAAPSPQIAGTTRYAFQSWSDGGAQTHQIMAPASATTFVANLTSQYALTLAASPSAGGRVSASPPASDGFYDAGTAVQLTAQPNPGYGFSNWTGDLTGSANPQTLIISAPRSATAVFTSGAATYTISGRITAGASGVSGVVVNITGWGTYTAITDSSGNYVFTNVPAGGTYTVTPSPAAYYFAPGATTLTGLSANRTVNFTAMAGSGLRFVPLTPCRLMETRALYNYEGRTGAFGPPALNAAETRTMVPSQSNVCQVPATAKAYVVNVTVVPLNGGVNFATLWPAGETRPNTWTIRSPDGQTVANSAIVKAGANGGVSLYVSDRTDLLIDISGYYTDSTAVTGYVYYPLTPCRVIDTRQLYRPQTGPFGPPSMGAQQTRRFRFPDTPYCTVPAAAAYSVTLTVVPPAPLAFLTAWPAGLGQPGVSSINSFAGRVLANSVIIPASTDGSIDVFVYNSSDVLMDINGYYAADDGGGNGLYFTPVTQCRASDSTVAGGAYADESTRTINVPAAAACTGIPANAKAYAINVTALPNGNPMPFLTAYPTGQPRPGASILNAFQGQVVTNAAIVPAGTNGSLDIYAYRRTDVVVEISGYFGR